MMMKGIAWGANEQKKKCQDGVTEQRSNNLLVQRCYEIDAYGEQQILQMDHDREQNNLHRKIKYIQ